MANRTVTVSKHTFPLDWSAEEVATWSQIWREVQAAKQEGRRVVFATGVFDLFHEEHQRFLEKARAAGNFLVVGVESDVRVHDMKGPGRPFNDEQQRLQDVLSSGVVDAAAILPIAFTKPEHHRAIISLLRPHLLAVSSHSPYQEAKRAILEEFGGQLAVVHDHNPAISTTQRAADRVQ